MKTYGFDRCPDCEGDGFIFYGEKEEEIFPHEYPMLPREKRHSEKCKSCNGEGVVESGYVEPDYYEYRFRLRYN